MYILIAEKNLLGREGKNIMVKKIFFLKVILQISLLFTNGFLLSASNQNLFLEPSSIPATSQLLTNRINGLYQFFIKVIQNPEQFNRTDIQQALTRVSELDTICMGLLNAVDSTFYEAYYNHLAQYIHSTAIDQNDILYDLTRFYDLPPSQVNKALMHLVLIKELFMYEHFLDDTIRYEELTDAVLDALKQTATLVQETAQTLDITTSIAHKKTSSRWFKKRHLLLALGLISIAIIITIGLRWHYDHMNRISEQERLKEQLATQTTLLEKNNQTIKERITTLEKCVDQAPLWEKIAHQEDVLNSLAQSCVQNNKALQKANMHYEEQQEQLKTYLLNQEKKILEDFAHTHKIIKLQEGNNTETIKEFNTLFALHNKTLHEQAEQLNELQKSLQGCLEANTKVQQHYEKNIELFREHLTHMRTNFMTAMRDVDTHVTESVRLSEEAEASKPWYRYVLPELTPNNVADAFRTIGVASNTLRGLNELAPGYFSPSGRNNGNNSADPVLDELQRRYERLRDGAPSASNTQTSIGGNVQLQPRFNI